MLSPTQIVALVGGVGTLIAGIVALARAGPDRTRAWVGTAADLVEVSDKLRGDLTSQIDYLIPEVRALRAEVAELKAHQQERDGAMRRIRARNRLLEDRVAVLERTLRTNDIPVPPEEGEAQ